MPYDFSVGVPDPALFPFDTWRRLVSSELRAGANAPGRYADPAGLLALREAVSRYVGVSRSVLCDPEDVVVTNGTQHAIDLVCRVVLDPGDTVAVEDPGYPPAATLFAASGMRVAPVPVDEEGLVVEALPARARLVYVTPSHQFPTGAAMSLRRRVALVEWAQVHDALVVEDDYDSEFRFSSRPLEPLVNLDPSGRVCYVGSFSKTMLPALRLGFVVAPPSLRPALRTARQLSDGFSPVPTQAALARFIDEGMLARHVRKASNAYARRHVAVLAALEPVPGLRVVPSSAGLHLCARLPGAGPATGGEWSPPPAGSAPWWSRWTATTSTRRFDIGRRRIGRAWWSGMAPWPTTGWTRGCDGWCASYVARRPSRSRPRPRRPPGSRGRGSR